MHESILRRRTYVAVDDDVPVEAEGSADLADLDSLQQNSQSDHMDTQSSALAVPSLKEAMLALRTIQTFLGHEAAAVIPLSEIEGCLIERKLLSMD